MREALRLSDLTSAITCERKLSSFLLSAPVTGFERSAACRSCILRILP